MSSLPDKFRDLFSPKTKNIATYRVGVMATHFRETTNVYLPKTPFDKLCPGMELIKYAKKLRRIKKEAVQNSQDKSRSIRRSIQRGKHIIRCNTFELYVTFTFANDRFDLEKCRRQMETWLENQKKRSRNGHFEYIIVTEFHKRCRECVEQDVKLCPHDDRPKPIHFHALLQGYKGKVMPAINPHTGKQLRKNGLLVYDIPGYRLGHMEAYYCRESQEDSARLEYYLNKLEKYLNKEASALPFGKKRFWYTRGLKKPEKEYNPDWFDPAVKPLWSAETEWGTHLKFTREQVEQMRKAKIKS